jgi:hypothetical protein
MERYIEVITDDREILARILIEQIESEDASHISLKKSNGTYRLVISQSTEPPIT